MFVIFIAAITVLLLISVTDRLSQPIIIDMVGELLTTIRIPCNLMQGRIIIGKNLVLVNAPVRA